MIRPAGGFRTRGPGCLALPDSFSEVALVEQVKTDRQYRCFSEDKAPLLSLHFDESADGAPSEHSAGTMIGLA